MTASPTAASARPTTVRLAALPRRVRDVLARVERRGTYLPARPIGRSSPSSERAQSGPPRLPEQGLAHLSEADVKRTVGRIVQAVLALEGDKPHYGAPTHERLLRALLDPVGEVDALARVIDNACLKLENACDTYDNVGASDVMLLMAEEKDRLILDLYRGYTPDEVSELEPALGDPLCVRRVRLSAGRDPETGNRAD